MNELRLLLSELFDVPSPGDPFTWALVAAMVADLLATDLQASRLVRAQGPSTTEALLAGLPPGLRPEQVVRRVASGTEVERCAVRWIAAWRSGSRRTPTSVRTSCNVPAGWLS